MKLRLLLRIGVVCLISAFTLCSCSKDEVGNNISEENIASVTVQRVYGSGDTYCAFTSVLEHEGSYYIAFREGETHVQDGDYGVIRILKSTDGEKWNLYQTIKSDNVDLRDPNLSEMPNGNMLLICGARRKTETGEFSTSTYYSIEEKGGVFADVEETIIPVEFEGALCRWIWRLTWNNDEGYGVIYGKRDGKYYVSLLKTTNGKEYEKVTDFNVPGEPTETKVRFMQDGTMIALVRRGYKEKGYMGKSKPPYTEWNWQELSIYLAGQDFIIDGDNIICSTRLSTNIEERTAIWYGDINGNFQWNYILPSSGTNSDTAYSSILKKDGEIWISYYSMHESQKPCIYLAKIPMMALPFLY